MNKPLKITLVVLGSILALLLLAGFCAGPIAKNHLQEHDKELIGRELSIGRINVNPFFGSANIKDLTLFEDDGSTPFVRFGRLKLKIKLLDLLKHRLNVKHATLSDLSISLEQNRDWFNFNSIKEHLAANRAERKPLDYDLIFNDISIENGAFRYADLAIGSEFLLRDISLRVPTVDLSDLKTDVGLDLALSDEATLHTDLRLSDNAKNYFIRLKVNKLGIGIVEPYLQQHYPVDLASGFVDLDVEAQGPTDHILDFDLNGSLLLNQVALQDTDGNDLGKIDSFAAKIKRFSLNDRILDFDQLHLSGLNTTYVVYADSTTNFQLVWDSFRHRDTTEIAANFDTVCVENQEIKKWKISIANLELVEGMMAYEDHTLPEVFRYEISGISLNSKRFAFDGDNAIQAQAALNKVGKLNLNWQGRLQGRDSHNLTLMLSNVKLADFSPYAVQWFGFPIEDGTLSFRSQNVVSNDNLNGINKLQIAAPKIGDKVKHFRPRFPKVPLKLGLYLLADTHNNVSLDLPVSGSLNDPSFSYGKTLRRVFSNLLVKVASSPFRLMTDEDNNLKYIPFDPLQFDFTPEQYVMIDNVAMTLQSRSDLGIVLEEQVQYDDVVKQLSILQLQRDYYLSVHPEMKSSDIDFITNEAIRSIKLNDKGLCEYAAQYSEKKRLRSAKDVTSVACAVYQEKSEKLLPKLMARRNEQLSNYLLNIKGLSPEQITVTTIDKSLLKTFVKPSRYEMHVFRYEDLE